MKRPNLVTASTKKYGRIELDHSLAKAVCKDSKCVK